MGIVTNLNPIIIKKAKEIERWKIDTFFSIDNNLVAWRAARQKINKIYKYIYILQL